MYLLPKSRLGKISLWLGLASFALIYLQYWFAMIFQVSVPPFIGLVAILCVLIAGAGSVISLAKYRDRAILLLLSALTGLLGLLLVLGELLLPH